jgi:HlyD family secretion protein
MKKKSLILIAVLAVLATVAFFGHRSAFAGESATYRFTNVRRGDVEASVSATGVLEAVTTVQVGTQVSGQLKDVLVDFNDTVKKGQLIARIDPTLQQQAVTDAQASLERAQAQARQAQRDKNRSTELMRAGLVARSEWEQTDSSLDVSLASVKSARVALEKANQNLRYTNIYAPIDGVVVERNVDPGQTVAASLSAPQLFLIANDLSNMQILAKVGESDIAGIRQGQKVKFSVQALPKQTFEGTVKQVRLQSTTNENVVSYDVVIAVENRDRKLLPGMTARVDFVTDSASDVLQVANSALRFKPAPAKAASGNRTEAAGQGAGLRAPSQRTRSRSGGTIYVVDSKGAPTAIRVKTGVTDGTVTEISGEGVSEGMKVIAGLAPAESAATSTAQNPFQGNSSQSGGRRGRGGM